MSSTIIDRHPGAGMPISQSQIDAFIDRGFVLIDGLFPAELIDAASSEMDRLYAESDSPTGIRQYLGDQAFCALFQHPHLEAAAQAVLGCKDVHLQASATLHTEPSTEPWSYDPASEHVDIQYTSNDWLVQPRQVLITFMVFLDDIPPDRAPTVVRPGSHLLIAAHNGDSAYQDHPVNIRDLPALPFEEPVPLSGKKGQVAISTTALVHAGSRNASDRPRKMVFISLCAAHVCPPFNRNLAEKRLAWLESLRERFRSDRHHLLDSAIRMVREQCATPV
jgi:ectoine hydroxylase-related dioxygenase (phytanoyl-CoA dioxygenase family)